MVIVGIDEVGRGSWAGPLVAGAVILGQPITGLMDSKQLSKSRRQSLDKIIREQALGIGIGWVSPELIDEIGLTEAVSVAMRQAVDQIKTKYDQIIIDGNYNFLNDLPSVTIMVKADALVPAVSAASIVAKVARDNYMAKMAAKYPNYGFERHVGYGTALHLENLIKHGVCSLHRKSFAPVKAIAERSL
jgi:ribonuclease HII